MYVLVNVQLCGALMVSKKKRFGADEIAIFDDGCIYKRGSYWQFRLWLKAENKYARKSLGTTDRATAIERGKKFYVELIGNIELGKKYFSLTAKEGVRLYGSKPIEFAKGKNAIELSSASEIAPTLSMISDAVMNGELDAAIAACSTFGRKAKKSAA